MKVFTYKGEEFQQIDFIAFPGTYKIECWGGEGFYYGGKGGYASGYITFRSVIKLFIYVGGVGISGNKGETFNGGGHSQYNGGGASDVRLIKNDRWDDFESLKSRIIVAGGGGAGDRNTTIIDSGGAGGGIIGKNSSGNYGKGGQQTKGGDGIGPGKFGKGGSNSRLEGSGEDDGNGAGGGGYFGGGASTISHNFGGGGGSSFISGHQGCIAIDYKSSNEENIIMKEDDDKSFHYSGLKFIHTQMFDGTQLMPSIENGFEEGHSGSGAVRITFFPRYFLTSKYQFSFPILLLFITIFILLHS